MKKVLIIGICLLFVFLLTGCGTDDNSKILGCSDCVFSHNTTVMKIGEELGIYETDPSIVDHDFFVGYKLEDSIITSLYLCGRVNNKTFCIEGNNDGSKYKANKRILKKVYSRNDCSENDADSYFCDDGNLSVTISEDSYNIMGLSKSDQCYASSEGSAYCYFSLEDADE